MDGLNIFALMAKALTLSPPTPGGLDRQDTRADGAPARAQPRRRGFFERLDHWFWIQQQRGVEAYLAKATDVHDLETRIRGLERKSPYPYY
jgi:hypothetical protein